MATLQIRIDDTLKNKLIHYFLVLGQTYLNGPFDNAEDAVSSMLED